MAWLNKTMPNQTVKNGLKAKKIATNKFFSRKTTNEIFMYLLAPFILQNLQKIKSYEDVPFQAQNGTFALNKIFLVQTIIITFVYLLALFIVENLKKFLQQIQSYEDAPFFGPKIVYLPQTIFFLENY